jgi:anti-sigma-K factor RskA
LLLALFAWYRTPQSVFVPVQSAHNESRPLEPTPAPEPTPGVERTELLAHSGTVKIPLAATKDPAAGGVTGDVVWDPVTQRGYMRFVGLPHNDPSAHQYQIWIFDGGRDQRYPIDGGVFDVPADGAELIVPIHHAIPVHVAKAFAVTVEKPGGVVVSARDHVVVLAQAS